jgi:pimeloyl-ACP methyl ester carboxylesterase
MNKVLAAVATVLGFTSAQGYAQTPPQSLPPALQVYLEASHTVTLDDGRKLQLVCMGQGSPTVVLAAGSGAPSIAWFLIQPVLAERTQVCSWSRAGYGLSSASPFTQTVGNRLDDLEAALEKRGIRGPFVFAGASLGAYESVLFADRHPRDTVGLVLLDPAIPEQIARRDRVAPELSALGYRSVSNSILANIRCAVAERAGLIGSGKPDPNNCFVPPIPPTAPEAIRRAFTTVMLDAASFETQASLLGSAALDSAFIANPDRNYGSMPLIVLSAGEMEQLSATAPDVVRLQYPAFFQEIRKGGAEYAALSSRGIHRIVEGSTHDIPAVRPDAVIEAIGQVLDEAR